MDSAARVLFEKTKQTFGHLVTGLQELEWDQLPPAVIKYIQDNPKTTAFQLACLLVVAMPSLVATPGLFALGFSPTGPMAGESHMASGIKVTRACTVNNEHNLGWLASAFQSMYGTVLGFSTLQSAAMGGWGVGYVYPVVQAGAAVVGGFAEIFKWN